MIVGTGTSTEFHVLKVFDYNVEIEGVII